MNEERLDLARAEQVQDYLDAKNYPAIKELLQEMNPADLGPLFDEFPEHVQPILFRLLPKDMAADVFAYMEPEQQQNLLNCFSDKELEDVMADMFADDAADFIEEMPAGVVWRILRHTDPEMRATLNQLLNYPKDSAGSIMTTEFVDLKQTMSVVDAFDRIRKTGIDKETIYTCYVTDDTRRLEGIVTVKDLLLSPKEAKLSDIMETNVISVRTTEDQEHVAALLGKYDFLAVPVVDAENRLVGIVTVDDAIDVIQEEATEDIEKMAAIVPADKPYMRQSVFSLYKSRIFWLLLLMVSATFTGGILASFENTLATFGALTMYIPMLMDTGGNCGGQSSTSVVRAMSLGEIEYRDFFRVLWKESRVAILCGVTLAAANFVKVLVIDHLAIPVALVVCLTLVFTVFMAKVVGCILPIGAKRVGWDPAVMASPIITTIVDAFSLLIYMNIANLILA